MDQQHKKHESQKGLLKVLALGLLCFVCAFLGAWAAVNVGLIKPNEQSIVEKRSILTQEGEVVARAAEKLSASVVSIVVEDASSVGLDGLAQQGAGTGIVISKDGYILTNRHVVAGASSMRVVMADGTTHEQVKLIGVDPANDIAFLKIDGVNNLTAAPIGDSSKTEVGEKVIAIGNALGQYETTVTSGIISGLGRPIVAGDESGAAEQLSNLLQTDAAINPGNSGGPLVNLEGEVIGINTAIDQEGEGIGFAIPINDAKGLIKTVTSTGQLKRAFLGVSHIGLTKEIAADYLLGVSEGAYIHSETRDAVTPGSPADKAGLKQGDIITAINGRKINARNPLLSAISQHVPGDAIEVTYIRDGAEKTVKLTLGTYPSS